MAKLSLEERKLRAENDARILADAKAIMDDPARMKAAANAAKKMLNEKQAELKGLKQVAKKAK